MNTSDINGRTQKQYVVSEIPPHSPPQPTVAHDLQVWRLGQRFALTPEMARTYADLAFNAGVRP
jgi:hypothetical protein